MFLVMLLHEIHALHKLGGQEDYNAEHWLRPQYEFETLTRENKVKFHDRLPREIK